MGLQAGYHLCVEKVKLNNILQILRGYFVMFMNCWTNTKLVCIRLNAFYMLNQIWHWKHKFWIYLHKKMSICNCRLRWYPQERVETPDLTTGDIMNVYDITRMTSIIQLFEAQVKVKGKLMGAPFSASKSVHLLFSNIMFLWEGHQFSAQQACYHPNQSWYPYTWTERSKLE